MTTDHDQFVAHRVRELEAFEGRARGEIPNRKGKREGQLLSPKQTLFQNNGAKTMQTQIPDIEYSPAPPPRTRTVRVPSSLTLNGEAATVPAPMSFSIIQAALASGNVDMYREAVALAKELDAIASKKAFDNAMASAKAEIPVIRKNRRVGFDSRRAGAARTDYAHEDMAEIARTVDPILSKHGLSYRFRTTSAVNEPVTVTCIISHKDGHSEETSLRGARDESGNKNALQAIGSTVTYLQRYTLKAALGLSAAEDDDARTSEPPLPADEEPLPGTISAVQAAEIRRLLDERGVSHRAFLNFIRLPSIEHIGVEHFDRACAKIKSLGRKS